MKHLVRFPRAIAVGATVAIATALGFGAVAIASPGSGTVSSVVIGAGRMATGMGFNAHPGTNTVVAQFTFGPNSSTGWHSHPGKTLVTVQSGTFTVYHDDCHSHTYQAGEAFVELPSSVHVGRNETGENVQLGVVFFGVPIGGSPRIDQPQPDDCEVT